MPALTILAIHAVRYPEPDPTSRATAPSRKNGDKESRHMACMWGAETLCPDPASTSKREGRSGVECVLKQGGGRGTACHDKRQSWRANVMTLSVRVSACTHQVVSGNLRRARSRQNRLCPLLGEHAPHWETSRSPEPPASPPALLGCSLPPFPCAFCNRRGFSGDCTGQGEWAVKMESPSFF